jgi:hypothetical protein
MAHLRRGELVHHWHCPLLAIIARPSMAPPSQPIPRLAPPPGGEMGMPGRWLTIPRGTGLPARVATPRAGRLSPQGPRHPSGVHARARQPQPARPGVPPGRHSPPPARPGVPPHPPGAQAGARRPPRATRRPAAPFGCASRGEMAPRPRDPRSGREPRPDAPSGCARKGETASVGSPQVTACRLIPRHKSCMIVDRRTPRRMLPEGDHGLPQTNLPHRPRASVRSNIGGGQALDRKMPAERFAQCHPRLATESPSYHVP